MPTGWQLVNKGETRWIGPADPNYSDYGECVQLAHLAILTDADEPWRRS